MAEDVRIETILPSLEELEKIAEKEDEDFEEEAMKIATRVAENLKRVILLDVKEILQGSGATLVVPESYFHENGNGSVSVEMQERSMQIVVGVLRSSGLSAGYNQPKPDGDNNEKDWSINISKY